MKLRALSCLGFVGLFACGGGTDTVPIESSPPPATKAPPRDAPGGATPPDVTSGRPFVACKEDGRAIASKPLAGVVREKPFTLVSSTGQLFNASGPDTSTEFVFAATQQVCPTDAVVPTPSGVHVTVNIPQHLLKAGTSVALGPFGSEPAVSLMESIQSGSANGEISQCGRVEFQEVDTDPSSGKVTRVKLGIRAADVYGDAVEGVADVTYCP